jgi:GT2 family glycosyltransferase
MYVYSLKVFMPMIDKIDIVVVNWNSGAQLAECVESIQLYGKNYVECVVVVDNGSSDGSMEINGDGLNLKLIRANDNLGFAGACNRGAAQCKAPYILFLNPDAMLMAGSLETSISFMSLKSSSDIGICGVQLIDEFGATQRNCARFPSWRTYFGLVTMLKHVVPSIFPSHFLQDFDHKTSRSVDQVIGAFFLVRRKLFLDLRGFDERFFVYFEELDFSLRALRAGWTTWYLAEAIAFHKGGGVTDQVKAHRLFYSLRSRLLYAFKHFSSVEAWTVVAITLLLESLSRSSRAVIHLSLQELRDTTRGFCMLILDLPKIFRVVR